MNHVNDAIETVLKSLGTAEPSAGFEARMIDALQKEHATRSVCNVPWTLVAALATLLCGVAVGLGIHVHHPRNEVAVTKPVLPLSPAVPPHVGQEAAVHGAVPRPRMAKLVRDDTRVNTADEDATTHQNIPPPPLPLTQDERLVLRMVRHNDLPQLATLSSESRARSLHEDAEEYRAFFAPRPPLEGQPYYEQHIISGGSQ